MNEVVTTPLSKDLYELLLENQNKEFISILVFR